MDHSNEQIDLEVQRLWQCNSRVARKAIKNLVHIGQPAVPALTEAATHESTFVRRRALVALQLIGRQAKQAIQSLTSALGDSRKKS